MAILQVTQVMIAWVSARPCAPSDAG